MYYHPVFHNYHDTINKESCVVLQGKMTFGNVAIYEGDWKNDLQDGEGKLVFTNGSLYHGTWLEGKRHGQGQTQVQHIVPSKEIGCKVSAYSQALALKGKPDSIYAHTYTGDWIGGLPHGRLLIPLSV